MTELQTNLVSILAKLMWMVKDDPDTANIFATDLEKMLNELHNDDFFGTEGQNDPRGDFRNGTWSVDFIEPPDR